MNKASRRKLRQRRRHAPVRSIFFRVADHMIQLAVDQTNFTHKALKMAFSEIVRYRAAQLRFHFRQFEF